MYECDECGFSRTYSGTDRDHYGTDNTKIDLLCQRCEAVTTHAEVAA
jgi:ribosomal protein L37E